MRGDLEEMRPCPRMLALMDLLGATVSLGVPATFVWVQLKASHALVEISEGKYVVAGSMGARGLRFGSLHEAILFVLECEMGR